MALNFELSCPAMRRIFFTKDHGHDHSRPRNHDESYGTYFSKVYVFLLGHEKSATLLLPNYLATGNMSKEGTLFSWPSWKTMAIAFIDSLNMYRNMGCTKLKLYLLTPFWIDLNFEHFLNRLWTVEDGFCFIWLYLCCPHSSSLLFQPLNTFWIPIQISDFQLVRKWHFQKYQLKLKLRKLFASLKSLN